MTMWKNGKTTDEVAEELLRNYLIRCHRFVSKDYPEIARMEPTKAADYLLHLRKTGRIEITHFNKSPSEIGCKIVDVDSGKGEDGQNGSG
jgi:predicted metal-dependent enzyme (double-stranded beta helix superfamily)